MTVALELSDQYRCRVFNMLIVGQTARSFINVYENSGLEFTHTLTVISRVTLWVLLSSFFWNSSYDSNKLLVTSSVITLVLILIELTLPIDSLGHPFHLKTLSVITIFFSYSPGSLPAFAASGLTLYPLQIFVGIVSRYLVFSLLSSLLTNFI